MESPYKKVHTNHLGSQKYIIFYSVWKCAMNDLYEICGPRYIASEAKRRNARRAEGSSEESSFY